MTGPPEDASSQDQILVCGDEGRAQVMREARAVLGALPHRDPLFAYRTLAGQCLLYPSLPTRYGGRGQRDPLLNSIVTRELVLAGLPEIPHMVTDVALHGLLEQRPDLLETRAPWWSGTATALFLWTEPAGGSGLATMTCRARQVQGSWEVSGTKVFSRYPDMADAAVVVARDDSDGVGLFLAPVDHAGVDLVAMEAWSGDPFYRTRLTAVPALRLDRGGPSSSQALLSMTARERTGLDYLAKVERAAPHSTVERIDMHRVLSFCEAIGTPPVNRTDSPLSAATKWAAAEALASAAARRSHDARTMSRPVRGCAPAEAAAVAQEAALSGGASEALLDEVGAAVIQDPDQLWNRVLDRHCSDTRSAVERLIPLVTGAPDTAGSLLRNPPRWTGLELSGTVSRGVRIAICVAVLADDVSAAPLIDAVADVSPEPAVREEFLNFMAAVGAIQKATRMIISRAGERTVAGRPLTVSPVTRQTVARCAVRTASALALGLNQARRGRVDIESVKEVHSHAVQALTSAQHLLGAWGLLATDENSLFVRILAGPGTSAISQERPVAAASSFDGHWGSR